MRFAAALMLLCPGLAFPQAKQPSLQACSLLTRAEADKVTGHQSYTSPEPIGASGCGFDQGQLLTYTGADAEAQWERTLKTFGHEKAPRTPLTGLGEKAYVLYPKPRDQYEDTSAVVVVKRGNYVISMAVYAEAGKSAQSALAPATELAKIVLSRLK